MKTNITNIETPFYLYNIGILKRTLEALKKESSKYNYHVHYALKANANDIILNHIMQASFGADCVSGNEITKALSIGFDPNAIVFAGVGKTDKEIDIALRNNIFCFNCESMQEIEQINIMAAALNKKPEIALRVNPEINAHTHKYITTGTLDNKFGIALSDIPKVLKNIRRLKNINLIGLHVHIGSQINNMKVFEKLCQRVNSIQDIYNNYDFALQHINLGGGLGVNYHDPQNHLIPDFEAYFSTIHQNLNTKKNLKVHVELGRSVVAQSASLITKALYVKKTAARRFVITDAGMTDLLRPALYNSFHHIENISSSTKKYRYDIVGPICESADFLGKNVLLSKVERGDILSIHSVGAYGEVMAFNYNLREKPKAIYME